VSNRHFCPSTADKTPIDRKPRVRHQIDRRWHTSHMTNHAKHPPETHRKMRSSRPIFASFCHLARPFDPGILRLFDPLALPPLRQNYPIPSPFSDFHWRATKFPPRNRSTQSAFVQPNCNDRILPPRLAPRQQIRTGENRDNRASDRIPPSVPSCELFGCGLRPLHSALCILHFLFCLHFPPAHRINRTNCRRASGRGGLRESSFPAGEGLL